MRAKAATRSHSPEALKARRKARQPAAQPPRGPLVDSTPVPGPSRPNTKLGALTLLLERPDGAPLVEMMGATGWQAHSVRGAMAGALKKKGLTVTSEKVDGVRIYKAAAVAVAVAVAVAAAVQP